MLTIFAEVQAVWAVIFISLIFTGVLFFIVEAAFVATVVATTVGLSTEFSTSVFEVSITVMLSKVKVSIFLLTSFATIGSFLAMLLSPLFTAASFFQLFP